MVDNLEDDQKLREILGPLLRKHVAYQDGRSSKAPSLVFADADYEMGDGPFALHLDGKYADEPAIVYVRADALVQAVARAEAAEAALPSVSAKAAEYHAIANAYAMWVSDVCELLEERIGEWDLDDPADAKLKDLMDRAELGIAKETRAALGEGD